MTPSQERPGRYPTNHSFVWEMLMKRGSRSDTDDETERWMKCRCRLIILLLHKTVFKTNEERPGYAILTPSSPLVTLADPPTTNRLLLNSLPTTTLCHYSMNGRERRQIRFQRLYINDYMGTEIDTIQHCTYTSPLPPPRTSRFCLTGERIKEL